MIKTEPSVRPSLLQYALRSSVNEFVRNITLSLPLERTGTIPVSSDSTVMYFSSPIRIPVAPIVCMIQLRRYFPCLRAVFTRSWYSSRLSSRLSERNICLCTRQERTPETLIATVRTIFKIIKHMEHEVWYKYPQAVYHLPDEIYFIDSEDLRQRYPDLSPKERENEICREKGCVFLMRIGDKLGDGKPHDGRAPDYDDWQLNGDILFWFEPLHMALEISSMGIRVSEESMAEQLRKAGAEDRRELPYHRMILEKKLPYTIGGGIGQSRLCMLLLGRAHVGEVQAGLWPEEMRRQCQEHNMILL